ncbi:MAG: hypothetical protein IPO63_10175 [Bacteroidetes bacterium]|nr:hypothetical protein [Bacteroidota bacterium]
MIKFSGWNSLSKKFLAEQTEHIDLFKLINDYHQLIEKFYHWFIGRQMEIHKDDIEKVDEHKNRIRKLEISNFLTQFIKQTKTVNEFEDEIFQYFPDEELEEIKSSITSAEKVEKILRLLNKVNIIEKEMEDKIRTSYITLE